MNQLVKMQIQNAPELETVIMGNNTCLFVVTASEFVVTVRGHYFVKKQQQKTHIFLPFYEVLQQQLLKKNIP